VEVFTYRPTNGTKENGIGVLCGVQSFVGQGGSGSIDRCLQGSRQQLAKEMPAQDGVTYTTKQLILEVEGSVVTAILNDTEDLAFDGTLLAVVIICDETRQSVSPSTATSAVCSP
jgi:hypothetical protein